MAVVPHPSIGQKPLESVVVVGKTAEQDIAAADLRRFDDPGERVAAGGFDSVFDLRVIERGDPHGVRRLLLGQVRLCADRSNPPNDFHAKDSFRQSCSPPLNGLIC